MSLVMMQMSRDWGQVGIQHRLTKEHRMRRCHDKSLVLFKRNKAVSFPVLTPKLELKEWQKSC